MVVLLALVLLHRWRQAAREAKEAELGLRWNGIMRDRGRDGMPCNCGWANGAAHGGMAGGMYGGMHPGGVLPSMYGGAMLPGPGCMQTGPLGSGCCMPPMNAARGQWVPAGLRAGQLAGGYQTVALAADDDNESGPAPHYEYTRAWNDCSAGPSGLRAQEQMLDADPWAEAVARDETLLRAGEGNGRSEQALVIDHTA